MVGTSPWRLSLWDGGPSGVAQAASLPWHAAHGTLIDLLVLRRVRALLVKAESTTFQDEADALTAGAQQLMTQHSVTRTLAENKQPQRRAPIVRRMWLDAPYVKRQVAAGRSRGEQQPLLQHHVERVGFVTLVGHAADRDTIELLTTSLLCRPPVR